MKRLFPVRAHGRFCAPHRSRPAHHLLGCRRRCRTWRRARTNSAAAESAFKTAIAGASGTRGPSTFELATPGYYTNFNVGSIKVTLTGVTNDARRRRQHRHR